jgi:nitrogen regulatory protein PII
VKYIVAIIQPDRLDEVVAALTEAEINLMTVSDVMGRGRQKGVAEVYRSHVEPGGLLRKVKLEIAVNDEFVPATIEAIVKGAHVRIRTAETGHEAIG